MKIRDIANHMNDYGTKPRIQVYKRENDYSHLIYEWSPYKISEEIGSLKVNSFTVRGAGFIEINAEEGKKVRA